MREAEPPRTAKGIAPPELLPALDPNGDAPSDPGPITRPPVKSTLLPPPSEPVLEPSLEGLMRAVRRA